MGCCNNSRDPPTSNGNNVSTDSAGTAGTYESVQDYYGKVLATSKDLKTSACTASGRPHPQIIDIMRKIPAEVMDKFYGCGAPLPLGVDGLKVLDLGSGSGRDAYVCAALVGEQGQVTGIDMTQEQIQVFVLSQNLSGWTGEAFKCLGHTPTRSWYTGVARSCCCFLSRAQVQ